MTGKYATRRGNVITHPAFTTKPALARWPKRAGVKRLHHYTPGMTPNVMPSPTAAPQSIPSRASVPPPSPTSAPLSVGFDDSGSHLDPYKGMSGNVPGLTSEADYYNEHLSGLGDNVFSDIFTTVSDAYKAQQAAKTAASQAATAQAQAAQAAALRGRTTSLSSDFLGLSMTTWLMIAGGGLGAYLLLSRKKKRR